MPKPLPSVRYEVTDTAAKKLTYYGYDFDVAWTEIKQERKYKAITVLNFSGGGFVIFQDPAQSVKALQVMSIPAQYRGTSLEDLFGPEVTRSNFAFQSAVLNTTPADVGLFSSRQKMVRNSIFLVFKSVVVKSKGGLYKFQTQWVQGFQIGDPERDATVTLIAFDARDNQIEIHIGSDKKSAHRYTQADVNRVIFSLRPAPLGPSAAEVPPTRAVKPRPTGNPRER
ncbi:MAG: hypothetical protein HYX26_02225 [Acidobacteriales bacterium]|nr:hypothetical protein [Terriglobales bacterium]